MADNDTEEKLERLKVVREKIEEIKRTRSKLDGELDIHKKHLGEIKKTCNDTYQIDPEDLADNIKVLETEIETEMVKAEKLLGIQCEA
jgi:hypothetical protein